MSDNILPAFYANYMRNGKVKPWSEIMADENRSRNKLQVNLFYLFLALEETDLLEKYVNWGHEDYYICVWYVKQLWIARDGNYRQVITMTYNYSKLYFDYSDYTDGETSFYPSRVRERKRQREQREEPSCVPAKILRLDKQSKRKKVGKLLNHFLLRRKIQSIFRCNCNLWSEEQVFIESHGNNNVMNQGYEKAILQNMREPNSKENLSGNQEGNNNFDNPSSAEKNDQKVNGSTHDFCSELECKEKEDGQVGEIALNMTQKERSRCNQLKKNVTRFFNSVKNSMTKQFRKVNCFN